MTLNLQSKKYEKVIRKSDKEMKITNKQTCNESNLVDVFWTNINANTIAGTTDNECQLILIPMFPLYTPWKHQQTFGVSLWFSDVCRRYKIRTLTRARLMPDLHLQFIVFFLGFFEDLSERIRRYIGPRCRNI